MKILSVIIPIYNVASYLERCIRSLEDQDIPPESYEIICINDGSPDNSRDIILRMKREYNNIVLIDQTNKGVSVARNIGIDQAKGVFLLFIDPDDYVQKNSLDEILKTAREKDAQVAFLGFDILNKDGSVLHRINYENLKSNIYKGTEAYYLARGDGKNDPDRMWAVLYEREFMNSQNLRYLPDVPYLEDGELIARILSLAVRCIFSGSQFYFRTMRPGSATHSDLFKTNKALAGFMKSAVSLKKFQCNEALNESQKIFLNQPIVKFVILALNSSIRPKLNLTLRDTIRDLRSRGFKKLDLNGCNSEYKKYGRAYNFSPWYCALLIVFYPRIVRYYKKLFN